MRNKNLLGLLQLTDPALPVGGFAHSAGLETYVQKGIVHCRKTASEFISEQLVRNISYTDAAFMSLAFDASEQNDLDGLLQLDEECTAVKLPKELRQASQRMGNRMVKIFQPICCHQLPDRFRTRIESSATTGNYPVAFGLFASLLQVSKHEALGGFFYNAAAGMVTNCVKLVPLGQQDGQELLYSFHPLIEKLVDNSMQPDRNLIGMCCPGFDLSSMQHEHLYSRLFIS